MQEHLYSALGFNACQDAFWGHPVLSSDVLAMLRSKGGTGSGVLSVIWVRATEEEEGEGRGLLTQGDLVSGTPACLCAVVMSG